MKIGSFGASLIWNCNLKWQVPKQKEESENIGQIRDKQQRIIDNCWYRLLNCILQTVQIWLLVDNWLPTYQHNWFPTYGDDWFPTYGDDWFPTYGDDWFPTYGDDWLPTYWDNWLPSYWLREMKAYLNKLREIWTFEILWFSQTLMQWLGSSVCIEKASLTV